MRQHGEVKVRQAEDEIEKALLWYGKSRLSDERLAESQLNFDRAHRKVFYFMHFSIETREGEEDGQPDQEIHLK